MRFLEHFHHPEKYFRIFIKWSLLGLIIGLLGGLLGAVFSHTLSFVTDLRRSHPWILFLLPVGGLATIGLYRSFNMSGNRGANEIIQFSKARLVRKEHLDEAIKRLTISGL